MLTHGRHPIQTEACGACRGDEQAAEKRCVAKLLAWYADELGSEVCVRR